MRVEYYLQPSDQAADSAAYTTEAHTDDFNPGPAGVLVWCTTDAYVKVGPSATATTADTPIPANTPVAFWVADASGAPWRVSAVQVSSGGTVYAKPLAQ
jgi:hypothetical protein